MKCTMTINSCYALLDIYYLLQIHGKYQNITFMFYLALQLDEEGNARESFHPQRVVQCSVTAHLIHIVTVTRYITPKHKIIQFSTNVGSFFSQTLILPPNRSEQCQEHEGQWWKLHSPWARWALPWPHWLGSIQRTANPINFKYTWLAEGKAAMCLTWSQFTSSALMRCFRATIRLGTIEFIWFWKAAKYQFRH